MSADDHRLPIAAWLLVAVAYFATTARVLTHADSPEFVTLLAEGGFAHPPGYPTVVLFYRAFSWIPLDPRLVGGYATALVGLGAVALVYFGCRAWGAGRLPATGAMLLVGLNTQVWLVHTHPEVFAFNNAFAAAIVLLSAPGAPLRGAPRVAMLGLLAGLGIGAHHSLVLLAPLGLWGVYEGAKESDSRGAALLAGVLCLALGLSVYGYLFIAQTSVSFGKIRSFAEVVDHFLRTDYGTASLGASGELSPMRQLSFWVSESLSASLLVGFALLLGGMRMGFGSRDGTGWGALIASWCLAGPLFVLLFNVDPVGPNAEIVKRFHVLPVVLSGPFVAEGLTWVWHAAIDRRLKVGGGIAVLALLLVSGVARTERIYSPTLEDYLRNTLDSLPEDAVLIGQGDHRYFGFQYLQSVEGLRPDVVVVEPIVLGFDWYVDRVSDQLGLELDYAEEMPSGPRRVALRSLIDLLLTETERPVYVTRDFAPGILQEYRMVPEGAGWRLLRQEETALSGPELIERNRRIYDRFEHRDGPPYSGDNPWGWSVWNTYTRVWQDLLQRCEDPESDCVTVRRMLERYPDL